MPSGTSGAALRIANPPCARPGARLTVPATTWSRHAWLPKPHGDLALKRGALSSAPRLQNLRLTLDAREFRSKVCTPAAQGIANPPDLVRREDDERNSLVRHGPEARNGELPFREHFEKHRFELLIYLVHLVDQQHARLRRVLTPAHERTLNEEIHCVEATPNGFPVRAELVGLCLQKEFLKGGIELPDGLLFIDTGIALQALQRRVECKGQSLRQLRLPTSRWALNEDRLLQLACNIDLGDGDFINDVLGLLKFVAEIIN